MPVRPASTMLSSFRCRERPFVVRQSSRRPRERREPIWCMRGRISRRTVGSPPVRRILVTPCCTKTEERRKISGVVRRCSGGDCGTPSSGMQ